jgi:hypothetical protein
VTGPQAPERGSTISLVRASTSERSVRVVVRSSRVGHPGHPMVRDLMLCASHARQLRQLGVELVTPKSS